MSFSNMRPSSRALSGHQFLLLHQYQTSLRKSDLVVPGRKKLSPEEKRVEDIAKKLQIASRDLQDMISQLRSTIEKGSERRNG